MRNYAQRNNNVTQLIPQYVGELSFDGPFDISGSIYSLNLTNVQYTGGIYYVDLSGNDSSGNPLNFDGYLNDISGNNGISLINFAINSPFSPAYYPGLEITIFFKNVPYDRLDIPFLTIGLISSQGGIPLPYILSPPFPPLISERPNIVNQSITLKSDGERFNVSSSGPAGWLGLPALFAILNFYTNYYGIGG